MGLSWCQETWGDKRMSHTSGLPGTPSRRGHIPIYYQFWDMVGIVFPSCLSLHVFSSPSCKHLLALLSSALGALALVTFPLIRYVVFSPHRNSLISIFYFPNLPSTDWLVRLTMFLFLSAPQRPCEPLCVLILWVGGFGYQESLWVAEVI